MKSEYNGLRKNKDLASLSIPSSLFSLMEEAKKQINKNDFKIKQSDFIRLALEYFSKAILNKQIKKIEFKTSINLN